MMNTDKDIIILGLGSEILSDEGIGAIVVKKLEKSGLYNNIKFESSHLGGLELIELLNNYKKAIIIDSIKSRHGEVGEISLFSIHHFKETLHISNPHDTTFLNTLELGRSLDYNLPDDIDIIAIEIENEFEISIKLSARLERKLDYIVNEIKNIINSLINTPANDKLETKIL